MRIREILFGGYTERGLFLFDKILNTEVKGDIHTSFRNTRIAKRKPEAAFNNKNITKLM